MPSSTIDPSIPAFGTPISAAGIRAQFAAAISDIDALFGLASPPAGVPIALAVTFGGAATSLAVVCECVAIVQTGIVTLHARVLFSYKGTSTGQLAISGFPAPLSTEGVRLECGPWSEIGGTDLSAILTGDTVTLFNGPPNGVSAPLADPDVNNGTMIVLSGSYLAG